MSPEDRIAALERRIAALELKPVDIQPQTAPFRAQEGQHCIIEAPPAGLTVTLPHARAQNRNGRITFTLRNSNPVTFQTVDGKVNNQPVGTMAAPGTFDAVSDGLSGWAISVLATGASGTSASTPTWSTVLGAGNHSGAHTPIVDSGSALSFASGSVGLVASGDLLVNVADDLTVETGAATRLTIDSTGAWNLDGTTPGTAGQYFRSGGTGAEPTWASIVYSELPSIADDTVLGNISGGTHTPVAVNLSDLDSTSIVYDAASHTFQRAALTGDVTASQNSNAATIANSAVTNAKMANMVTDTFKGNVSGSTAAPSDVNLSTLAGAGIVFGTHTLDVTAGAGGSIVVGANDVQRAALTGAVTASQDSNATAFGALAAKSVLANAINASAVPAALAGSASFQHLRVNSANTQLEWSVLTTGDFPANSVPLSAFPTEATDTFLANVSGSTAVPSAVNLSTLAGSGLSFGSHALAVATSTSIVVAASQVQRAALTGDVTALQNGNTTFFRSFAAKSVLANATNASAQPSDLASSAANQYLRVNSGNTALEWGTLPAGSLPTIQPGSFLGLQVDAGGAATAIEITGAEAGENIRFGTAQNDTTSTGTVNAYSLNANTTQVVFGAGAGTITLNGIAAPASFAEGREVAFIFDSGFTGSLSVVNLSGAASAGNKITTGNAITTTFVKGDSFTVRYENSVWRITALARRVPQYQINAGTAAPADTCNISGASGVSVSGGITSGAATYTVDTIRAAQLDLDVGTDTAKALVASLIGFRPGLATLGAAQFVTASTARVNASTYTIPANTLVSGSTYILFGCVVATRGSTATACNLTVDITVGGVSKLAAGAIAIATAAGNYGGFFLGFLTCYTTGASGTAIAQLYSLDQISGGGHQSVSNLNATFAINTTVSNAITLGAVMSAGITNVSQTWSIGSIMRVK